MKAKVYAKCGTVRMPDGQLRYVVTVYRDAAGLFIVEAGTRREVEYIADEFIFVAK